MDPDFVRIRQAAWLMYGIEHFDDVNLLDATLDDLREFVAGLDDDGLEELQRLADEFEIRDGVVWLSDIPTISSAFKWRVRMSKLYCVECPFPGGGKSSESRTGVQREFIF